MITFDMEHNRFNHRVAGACLHNDHVLLQTAGQEGYWALPGGRVEMQEDTRTALHREMREELDHDVEIGRLLFVAENFFTLSGKTYHELSLIYEMLPTDPALLEKSWTREITDGGVRIRFRWFHLEDLEAANLKPAFLRDWLGAPPPHTEHVVIRENKAEC